MLAAITLGGAVAFWRATTLVGLPSIPDPFDSDRDGRIDIPDDENAFTFYRRAALKFAGPESTIAPTTIFDNAALLDERHLGPLGANREALAHWFEGTKRSRAVYIQPREFLAETDLDVTQRFRSFAKLANLEAYRRQSEGDRVGAWDWLRANLRSSRHSGTNGCWVERIVGITNYERAAGQARVWADDPKVDASLLRAALSDVLAIDAMTPPLTDVARAEWFAFRNTVRDPTGREAVFRRTLATGPTSARGWSHSILDPALVVLFHEPERSDRVGRLLVANLIAAGKLAPADRAERVIRVGPMTFYGASPGDPGHLAPGELATWFDSTRYARVLLDHWSGMDGQLARDERNRAGLIVHLAGQVHLRDRGRLPDSPEALVGPYLRAIPPGYSSTAPEETPR